MIAEANGNNYGLAMASVVGTVVVIIVLMVLWGPERRGVAMAEAQRDPVAA
jgi:MFS transporter, SHS family, lactate transporter